MRSRRRCLLGMLTIVAIAGTLTSCGRYGRPVRPAPSESITRTEAFAAGKAFATGKAFAAAEAATRETAGGIGSGDPGEEHRDATRRDGARS